jgi:hypothetical protein
MFKGGLTFFLNGTTEGLFVMFRHTPTFAGVRLTNNIPFTVGKLINNQ